MLAAAAPAQAADFQVTNLNDTGAGSLRAAVDAADLTSAADRILFRSTLSGRITFGSEIHIEEPVEIRGPGASKVTLSGNDANRLFGIETGLEPVTISDLTLSDGRSAGRGGAVYVGHSDLTLLRSVIKDSQSLDSGGALFTYGPLQVVSSTLQGNRADNGGALYAGSGSDATVDTSTVVGNTASVVGGIDIYFGSGVIRSSTISGNSSTVGAFSGGIYANTPVSISNTIVANSTGGPGSPDLDVDSGAASGSFTGSFNLVEKPGGVTVNGPGNVLGDDPKLGTLAANGGPTPTLALRPGSAALDGGSATGADQRGAPRPFNLPGVDRAPGGNNADMGAYERVVCGGVLVNRVGTNGNDTLRGTGRADGLLGLGGRDLLIGLGGKDGLCGGGGRDKLKGGRGRDKLIGGAGRDRLIGGPGRDQQTQ